MIRSEGRDVPTLTEVVEAAAASHGLDTAAQARLLAELPELVQTTVEALRPQLEQALLDALLPRVLALLEGPTDTDTQSIVNG